MSAPASFATAIAFFVGWVFRTIRPVQVSNSPPSEIPAPGVERASGSQAERPTEQDFSAGGLGTQLPDPVDEERIYAAIAHEIETATFEKGLWTRLFAECDGDEDVVVADRCFASSLLVRTNDAMADFHALISRPNAL